LKQRGGGAVEWCEGEAGQLKRYEGSAIYLKLVEKDKLVKRKGGERVPYESQLWEKKSKKVLPKSQWESH